MELCSLCISNRILCEKASKCEILSLVELFQHAAKVVQCGRSFVSRMYNNYMLYTAAKVQELDYFSFFSPD